MENAHGIAQWNASGSRKKSIVAAGSRAEQLGAPEAGIRGGQWLLPERKNTGGFPGSRAGASENLPIREARENFCTIPASHARRIKSGGKHVLLLWKISYCRISKPVEPPRYHRLS